MQSTINSICNVAWTEAVIAAYQAQVAAQSQGVPA